MSQNDDRLDRTSIANGEPGRGADSSSAGDPAGPDAAAGPGAAASRTEPAASSDSGSAVSTDQVKMALRRVKDPELNLNIVDLGLIYDVAVEGAAVKIDMSLTSPGCPSGPEIMTGAESAIRGVPGVEDVTVNLVWSPMWTPDRIEPRVRAYLGF